MTSSSHIKRHRRIVTVAGLAAVLLAGCEVRPLDPQTGKAIIQEEATLFEAEPYVDSIWDDRLLPLVRDEAIDLSNLLEDLRTNREVALEQYRQDTGGRAPHLLVKGIGVVAAVDSSSRVGLAQVDLQPYDGSPDVDLQVGPVLRGTALRDALPFIEFDQFVNQLEFASVSNALHDRVRSEVLDPLELDSLAGRTITFHGAFTLSDERPVITPVLLNLELQ